MTESGYFVIDFDLKDLKELKKRQRFPYRDHSFDDKFQVHSAFRVQLRGSDVDFDVARSAETDKRSQRKWNQRWRLYRNQKRYLSR